jgi:hypothetical protein
MSATATYAPMRATPANGHITVNRLAKVLAAYPEALFALMKLHKIPVIHSGGAAFVRAGDVPQLSEAWAVHKSRPRLSAYRRPNRRYRPRVVNPDGDQAKIAPEVVVDFRGNPSN